jgi:hypothetical protein
VNPAVPEAEPALPSRTCARCGAFLPEDTSGAECMACGDKLRAERLARGLYPTWYILVLGVFGNFSIAGALSALNWRALGERTRERMAWGVAAMGLVLTVLWLSADSRMAFRGGLGLVGSLVAVQGLEPVYKAHRAAGGKRANLLEPLGLLAVALVLIIVLAALFGPED